MVHDLLVIGFATRTNSTPEAVRKKHQRLKPLARTALDAADYAPLRDTILAIANVRNAAAHETITDADVTAKFVAVWSRLSGGASWPDSPFERSNYCRALFSLIAFELGRWQVGLPASGYFSGTQAVDWSRFANG